MNNHEIVELYVSACKEGTSAKRKQAIDVISERLETSKKRTAEIIERSGCSDREKLEQAGFDVSNLLPDYQAMEEYRLAIRLESGRCKKGERKARGRYDYLLDKIEDQNSSSIEYQILEATNILKLQDQVRSYISSGFRPIGGVAVVNTGLTLKATSFSYIQAMIKDVKN